MSATALNILQAMETVFAKTFKRKAFRGDTWKAWRAFLAAAFALPMDAEAHPTYKKHTGRDDVPTDQVREAFAIVGRRGGKSAIAALIATYLSVFRDYTEILQPGETGVVMLIATDRKQARVLLNYVAAFFEIPMLKRLVIAKTAESITLTGHVAIEIHTGTYRGPRGRTVIAAICDEIAFWRSEDSANPDIEILRAVRPAMATIPNALLLAISSPYAKRGALWDSYRRYYGKPDAPVLVWQADTRSMNPLISQREIDRAFSEDAAAARAEFGAEFRDDVATFIDREIVERRVLRGIVELAPVEDVSYVAFVDPSGGSSDSMVLAIAHKRGDLAVLDLVREIVPPFSPEQVVAEFVETLKLYRVHSVTGDRYSGEWVREAFRKRGIEYRITEKNRSELYLDLLPMLNSGQCELLDRRKLIAQLSSLERRTARSGSDSIDHAPGSHDDVANAAAGALVEAVGGRRLHYAVLEAIKAETARIEQRTTEPLNTAADVCSFCGSSLIVRRGAVKHCNACGGESSDRWRAKPQEDAFKRNQRFLRDNYAEAIRARHPGRGPRG
jgi:hypothetical protein